MPSVIVTGGAGFIGSHVVERFLSEGWTVHVLDNLLSGKRENVPAAATLHELDIRDPAAAEVVRTLKPAVMIHLAAQMDVRKSVADPVYDASVNVVGTLNLLEAIRSATPTTRVVFASTGGAIYGEFTTPPNQEPFAKDPESPYAVAKYSAELYMAYYGRVHGMASIALRFGNVYGPRQDPHGEAGVVAIFCERILDGVPLTIFGDGSQVRDYVFVGDVADATWRASTQDVPAAGMLDQRAFNVGTGVGTSVTRLAELLSAAAQATPEIVFAAKRPGEQQLSVLNVEKIGRAYDWKPQVSLENGLRQTFEFFRTRHAQRPAGATT